MKPDYKVTCLDEVNGELVRVDASSKRWMRYQDAQEYAKTVAKSRQPEIVFDY